MILLDIYKRDPHFQRITLALDETRIGLANARQSRARVEAAQAAHDDAKRAYDDYTTIAEQLSESERQHAIRCKLSPREMLAARLRLPRDSYESAVDRPSTPTVRDQLRVLAVNGHLREDELPSMPADVAKDARIYTDVQDALEAVAQAIRDGKPATASLSTLQASAKALAEARGEDPARVPPLVDAIRGALAAHDPVAARTALDAITERFGMEMPELELPTTLRASAKSLGVFKLGDALPSEFKLFAPGRNATAKGMFLFDKKAADEVMASYRKRGVDLAIDLEHRSLEDRATSRSFDPDARGWCKLELRSDGSLWAVQTSWTPDGAARLREGRQRYVAPAIEVDLKTRRITRIHGLAISASPANRSIAPRS